MKRVLVTGALGHIGSRLMRSPRLGPLDEIVLLDNLAAQRYCSVFDLPDGVRFRFVEGDICSTSLEPLFEGVDCVVHLAAVTNAAHSVDRADEVSRINLDGTRRVASACAATGARLLFVSTTSVYGVQAGTVDEDCAPEQLQPQSPYAASKLFAERAIAAMAEASPGRLRYFIGRFGTIYGSSAGMAFHTAINRFCWQAAVGQPLTVWRTALNQQRPYLALTDAVRAIEFVLHADLFDNRIYNVVTENATVGQILDLIRAATPDIAVQYVDSAIMNEFSYAVSGDRFARAGFTPRGSLELGIQETLRLLRGVAGRPAVAGHHGG